LLQCGSDGKVDSLPIRHRYLQPDTLSYQHVERDDHSTSPWWRHSSRSSVSLKVPPNTLHVILGTGFTGQMTQPTVWKH